MMMNQQFQSAPQGMPLQPGLNRQFTGGNAFYQSQQIVDPNASMPSTCSICMANQINTVCIPCGHRCVCMDCKAKNLKECPICRVKIQQIVQTFDA